MVPKWMVRLVFTMIFAMMIANCSRESPNEAQGYIEGRYTYMATPVSGVLKEMHVVRGERVKRGQILCVLEAQPESDAYKAALENLNQSIASRDAIIANLAYAKITFQRYKILVPKNAIQQSMLDSAKSTYDSTVAQLTQANANIASETATLAQAAWTKDQKILSAPLDAIVFDTYFRLGEFTQANQAILSLLAPGDIKAIFYINESDLASIKLGDRVSVRCDRCSTTYLGRVSFISPSAEYTPPVIFSEKTNDKLIYRIEAEFDREDAYHLHPGQPVIVNYHQHG